jgi:hypothetical protein
VDVVVEVDAAVLLDDGLDAAVAVGVELGVGVG